MFSLDDFGTGYSSLTYLKRLQVAQLKIDQSFVRDMLDDPDDLAILDGVIGLAAAFGRQVIAEGVETVESGTLLLQLGCELAQGFGIARPMPGTELAAWAAQWRPDPAWVNLRAVDRDDLQLLVASVQHRAWVKTLESYILGGRDAPPTLDHQQCRFGRWLSGEGRTRCATLSAFPVVERLHLEVHELGAQLVELKAMGSGALALTRLGEINDLRDALLVQLQELLRQRSA
jgi:hypothetical protein